MGTHGVPRHLSVMKTHRYVLVSALGSPIALRVSRAVLIRARTSVSTSRVSASGSPSLANTRTRYIESGLYTPEMMAAKEIAFVGQFGSSRR